MSEDERPEVDSELPTVSRPADATGQTIAGYRVLQVVGEGGMGIVYEAEQEKPVRRRVALKLIKPGMDTGQVVARFESERQALALMSHPTIASIFDGGATEDGRPYFAMELVRGDPLTEYCDKNRLTVGERLDLFLQVCAGVQHAHQKGIIHRDLKPSNILVTIRDDEPKPKIIDFGIAKATSQRLTEKTLYTQLGQWVGTPVYMSPEQAEMSGVDVDTRTDVYSLGVVLYELLAGAQPFDPTELRKAGFEGIKRILRETEPKRPSTRVHTQGKTSADSARNRRLGLSALEKELRGDLDWITMKALEKDRTRRYGSPSELAADIRRHLRHEPVVASPPSAVYRARKFVRRHRVGVLVGALALGLLVAFAAAMTVQSMRIANERDRADLEAATAGQVADFLVRLFEISDPGESRGAEVTARELLVGGAKMMETELGDQPGVKARLLATLSRVHRSLGLYEDAAVLGEQSLDVHHANPESSDGDRAETLAVLGGAYSRLGRLDDATRVLEESLRLRQGAMGADSLEASRSMHDLGIVYWMLNRSDGARTLLEESLRIRESHVGPEHVDVGHAVRALGFVVAETDGHEAALPLYERSLRLFEKHHGEDHPLVADSLDSVGLTHAALKEYGLSRQSHDRALEIRERVLGEAHPVIAFSMLNLGRLLVDQGKLAEALPYYERGIAIREAALGPDHPRTADILQSTAICHAQLGQLDEAQELLERSNEIYEGVYGPDHIDTFYSRRNLGLVHLRGGDSREALRFLKLAAECGHPEAMSLEDPDLDSLRNDPEFEALVERVEAQLEARQSGDEPTTEGTAVGD